MVNNNSHHCSLPTSLVINNSADIKKNKFLEKLKAVFNDQKILYVPLEQPDSFYVHFYDDQIEHLFEIFSETSKLINATDGYIPSFYIEDNKLCFKICAFNQPASFDPKNLFELVFRPENFSYLSLHSSVMQTHSNFVENSIFASTQEKNKVFLVLVCLTCSESFTERYHIFLNRKDRDNWFSFYEEEPHLLAYLSLIAFFDNKVSQDELFMIHLVAKALEIKKQNDKTQVEFIKINCINSNDQLQKYLEKSNFALFAPNFNPFKKKVEQELMKAREDFLNGFEKKSSILRTRIEYLPAFFLSPLDSATPRALSVEESLYSGGTKFIMGYKIDEEEKACVLFAPLVHLELNYNASTIKQPSHKLMFGFSNNPQPFYSGIRLMSIASPLFKLPFVHDFKTGSELGVSFHDLCYHLTIEAFNPDVEKMVKAACAVNNFIQASSLGEEKPIYDKLLTFLEDREARTYLKGAEDICYNIFINTCIFYCLRGKRFSPIEAKRITNKIYKLIDFYPSKKV